MVDTLELLLHHSALNLPRLRWRHRRLRLFLLSSLVDDGLLKLLALEVDARLICRISGNGGLLLDLFKLHKSISVGLDMPDHMLFEQQVVCCCQVVVLVVLDRLEQALTVEALLSLQVANYLLIEEVGPLDDLIVLTVLSDDVTLYCLYSGWTDVEAWCFRLMDLIPWMLSNLFDVDTSRGIRDKYLRNHVFCFVRQKVWKIILSI